MSTPAYFLSLTVSNFRCFGPEPQTLDLSDGNGRPAQWTILLGENGTGKTTILQSLVSLIPVVLDRERNSFTPLVQSADRPQVVNDFRQALEDYVKDSLSTEPLYIYASVGCKDDGVVSEYKMATGFSYFNTVPMTSKVWHFMPCGEGFYCCGYGATRRISRKAISDGRYEDRFGTLFDEDAQLINAEEWLIQTDYAVTRAETQEDKSHAEKRLKRIVEVLKNVLPDVSDFRFTTSRDGRMTPRVEAQTAYGWARVADLSLGYKTTLAWIVDLAYRLYDHYPDSENPLAEPVVVLVDEIDLHLHPSWQRKLFDYLTATFPKAQFIVTAHSPLVVQAAPNANLALLRRKGDHVEIVNDIDYVRDWRVDQILTSDLFNQPTAYPPQKEPALLERRRILTQPTLSDADRTRLAELEAEIGTLPSGETESEIRARETIGRAAELLEQIAAKASSTSNGR